MKKLIIFRMIVFCGAALFAFSCGTICKIDKPQNLKTIDWENYNDVYTVYWNYKRDCSEVSLSGKEDTIKIYGWITYRKGYGFILINEESSDEHIGVECSYTDVCEELNAKLDTVDLTKKCYITGGIYYLDMADNNCCRTMARITIYSANDIYFEEE